MAARRDHYREAAPADSEAHPIDEEVERRLDHRALRRRIIAAQDHVMAALGERRDLWLELEPLLGAYQADREEAHFDIVYENGLVAGRADALAASLRRRAGHHALASRMARLAVNAAGVRGPGALVALLEVAWALALGPRQPQTSRRTRRAR